MAVVFQEPLVINAKKRTKVQNPIRMDPTRTTMLRRQLTAEMARRFSALRRAIVQLVDVEDAFGLRADAKAAKKHAGAVQVATSRTIPLEAILNTALVTNTRWRFETDDVKLDAYRGWLKEQTKAGILEVSGPNQKTPWLEPYIGSAYKKGMMRAYTDAHAADIVAAGKSFEFIEGGKKAFLDMSFNSPTAQGKLRMLSTRAYSQLEGVTAAMDQEMSRILAQGIAQGKGAEALARELSNSVSGIERKRARVIARTELVHAHAEGQLDSFEAMNIDEVGVMAEWSTATDSVVCELCAPLEGVILTVKEARGMIPRHPNCVAGDMRILAPGALAMLKTHYTGEIIKLVTVGGRHITVTPAHVLLTKYGFARAEAVYDGLDLVVDTGFHGRGKAPDYKHDVARVADEFVAATKTLGVPTVCVPTAPEYLHNEGRFCDEKIDIVFADGILGRSGKTHGREPGLYNTLPFCEGGFSRFALSTLAQIFFSTAHTSDSSMGRCRDALAFLLGCVLKAKQVRLGAISSTESNGAQAVLNNAPGNIKLLCDCLDRHPVLKKLNNLGNIDLDAVLAGGVPGIETRLVEVGLDCIPLDPIVFGDTVQGPSLPHVQFDKISCVRKFHVSSFPVYDVQTISTVYSIGGIIASNCRCAWIPANVGEHIGGTTKTTWAGPEQGLAPPGTKPTGKTTGQVWHKDEAAARLRQSIKAEHPKLSATAARKASRWAGADMTTVSGKLKPGSKAWISAKAAAKAEKAKASIAAVKVARKKKAVAATAHSLAVKIGMTKKKYGITDEMIFYPGGGKEPDFLIEGAEAWVKAQGLKVSDIEWLSFSKAAKARKVLEPTKPTLQAQAEVLSEMVAAKKATKALTDDAAKAVKAWSGTGPVAEVLDHADYRLVPGWEQLPAGSVKRQSYGVVLFDDQGRVLLREPTDHFGGTHWTFAKGGGWPPGSTALKELGEETGYIATIHDILPGKFKGTQTQTNYFLGKSSGFDPGLMDLETAGTKWMTYDEALAAIAQSKSATVVARDTAVLQAAYKHLSGGDPKLFAGVVSSGKDSLDAAKAVAAKAAHSHRVKLDMAQKHFAKPKFGGGVVDADWVNPGTKQKLNVDGLNKVLSEKGWHLTTLPKDVSTDLLGVADDVVTQKAIIDGLKKAPKTVPKPPAAKPTPKPHPALVSADEFTGDLHDDVAEALSKGHLHPDDVDYLDLSDTLMEWAEEKKLAPGWLDDFDHEMLAEHFNMFKKAHPNLYGKIDDIPAPRFPSGEEIEDIMGWTRPRAALPATVWDEKDFFKSGKLKKGAIYDKLKGHGLSDTQAADLTDKFIATSPKTYALPGQAAEAFDEFLEEPLVLAKMGKLPGAPPTAPILTETIEVPLERDLKKVANLPGSTKPWKAKDKAGKHWVVKDVSGSKIDPDHLRSEGLADELYRRLGIAVPKGKIINAPGGPMKITEFLEGGQTLAEWKVGKSVVKIKEMYAQIRKGAVADALFANHDVGGLSFDNIMVVGGKAYRIDNGGALLYRAQGGMKRTWKNKVTDLATMRDPKHNEVTAAIFEDLTDDEIHQQIRYIVAHKQDVLAAIVDDGLRGTMAARIDDLASRLPSRPAVRRPRAVPVGKRRAEYGNTPDAAPRAKAAKSNGVNLAGDKNDIEDDNILVWEQLGRDNKPQTRVQLKVTHEGSEKVKATLGDELERAQRAAAPTVTNPNVHPDDAYWDVVLAGAKTVSIHAGDGKFNTTILDKFAKAKEQVVKKLKTATGDKKKMLKHYAVAIDEIETAKRTGKTLPKGLLSQYVHKPKPKAAVPQPRRRDMRVRRDSGIDFPTADFKNGTGRVNTGHNNFSSEAYIIDMGDAAEGVEVKFLPNDGGFNQAKGRAMHGTISITVDGEVTQERIDDALSILKNLGLDIAPPPPAFEEALYIHRGVYLRGKHTSSGYKTIWENKSITDEEKVTQLKKWVKKNMQVDLDKVAQYDPAGVASNADGSGFRHWMRWDLSEDDVRREMSDYTIQHTTKGLSESPTGAVSKTLANILDSGGEFTSTTGRIRKGVSVGLTGGASSSSDINSGGGSYFFTRIKKVASVQAHGFFFRPSLLARQDPISYSSDTFGSISALHKRASTIEQFKAYARNSGNETIFKEGLSLADLDYIRIRPDERASVLKVFKDRGITTLPDGRPVEDIVITTKAPKKRNL